MQKEELKKKIKLKAKTTYLLSLVQHVRHFALKCQEAFCECNSDNYCGCASYMYCNDILNLLNDLEDGIKSLDSNFS